MRKLTIAPRPAACPDCGAVPCDCANDHLPVTDSTPAWLDGVGAFFTFAFLSACAVVALWSV